MRHLVLALSLGAMVSAARAQDDDVYRHVELRVSSTGPGTAMIDRGSSDDVAVGDLVLFYPRAGGTFRGNVVQVDDRGSVVELLDRSFTPETGTRGEVLVPKARRAPPPPQRQQPPPATPEREKQKREWPNKDEEWSQGMPLLAQVKPVRPEERARQFGGHFYTLGEINYAPEDNLRSSYLRAGTDLRFDNPFGEGGSLRLDGETNLKTETDDRTSTDLLLRRFSYTQGGTRFEPTRWEVGRFLQHRMPEFGVLDGFEWSQRTGGGDYFGASIGFLPELDDDFESFADFQLAAYYEWIADQRQTLSISGGLQKTFHNGKADRDLLVAKVRYLPADGWDVHGTVWIDYFYGRDDLKGTGFEVTQALASIGRRWDSGNGLNLSYRRTRFPELLRNGEFLDVLPAEITDNRYDRLALDGWRWLSASTRAHAYVSGYDDEEGSGGAGELGFDVADLFGERTRTDVTAFADRGQFEGVVGARASHGGYLENGRWDLFYEFSRVHKLRFADDADDLFQHRLRLSRTFQMAGSWDVALHAEARLWDDDLSFAAGFFMQRSF